jgi:hypothetical protein
MDFLRSGIHFASVDITNDKIKMRRTWGLEIPSACHIDLQRIFKLENDKTGMADMAVAVIEEDDYAEMKTGFPKEQHDFWEKTPLDACNIEYAARDAYVAYEVYRKIRIVNYGQRHLVPPPVPHGSPVWGYSDPEDD